MPRNDLILRIGAEVGPLKKTLKQLENTLVRAGNKLESIGKSLSLRVSAPIAAAGVASVAAFAEFQKLQKSLQAVSGSSREAEATLSRLRKLALQPGIDLQNAVTASIRLQAVGLEAQKAEDLILQFSKAVTLAGGTGEDLGEVVRQISQIISKGKVLSSDFRVIQERVPAIGIAMQNAFGSTNIEAIRETGISAREFVDRLTEGIRAGKEFQNVQGGLSNSLNNFQQAVQASLVTLGETIVNTIDLEGKLDLLANAITNAVDAFANLSPQTKTIILSLAGVAAAIGPVALGLGSLIKLGPLLASGFAALTGPVALVTVALGALAALLIAYPQNLSAAEKAQQRVNEALATAAQRTDEERSAVNALVESIKDETTSKGEKARAIEQLKRISPEYFGGLDAEKVKIDELTKASNQYNDSLSKRNALQEINAESLAAQEELEAITQQLKDVAAGGAKGFGANFVAGLTGGLEGGRATLEKKKAELETLIGELSQQAQGVLGATPTSAPDTGGAAFTPLSIAKIDAKPTEKAITEVVEAVKQVPVEPLQNLETSLLNINGLVQERFAETLSSDFQSVAEAVDTASISLERQRQLLDSLALSANTFAGAFNAAAKSQETSLKSVGNAALAAASQVVRAKVLEATASFFADAFAKLGIFGAVLAAGAGAVVGGLFGAVTRGLKIPALASGGIATGPTLALIGEGRESEAVIPLSKLNSLLDNNAPRERLITYFDIGRLYVELQRYEREKGRVN